MVYKVILNYLKLSPSFPADNDQVCSFQMYEPSYRFFSICYRIFPYKNKMNTLLTW